MLLKPQKTPFLLIYIPSFYFTNKSLLFVFIDKNLL